MPRRLPGSSLIAAALLVCLIGGRARGSERQLVFTQQSSVLEQGASELQPWTTFRAGRERYFSRLEGRLELERGLTDELELGLFWNFAAQTRDVVEDPTTETLTRVSESELASFSSRLKYELSDPLADALGSAVYLELTLGTAEAELAFSVIVDRKLGRVLLAGNLTGECRLESVRGAEASALEKAFVLEPSFGAAYLFARAFSAGLELRASLGLSGERDSSALFGGPVLAFADHGFWAALGVQPQLIALSSPSPATHLELSEHEKLSVRLLAGFAL